MNITAVRGILLEEIVLHLLEMVGYRVVKAGEPGTRAGHSGLEVQGRGEWHQIDALAAFDHTPAFMYPIRLMVEAKCYARKRTGIEIVRNAVGVLKDISENYFTFQPGADEIKFQRFNYHSAVFSTSGYSKNAERYAIAHQIFLIQYANVGVFQPIIQGILNLREEHFRLGALDESGIGKTLRKYFRVFTQDIYRRDDTPFTGAGTEYVFAAITRPLSLIRGSYFGMLQGKWPMHLLSRRELPPELFVERDSLRCRVTGGDGGNWAFVPVDYDQDHRNWFRLEFDLPDQIAQLVRAAEGDPDRVADVKRRHFSFISLSGRIGGVRRQIRLELDEGWLDNYLWLLRQRR